MRTNHTNQQLHHHGHAALRVSAAMRGGRCWMFGVRSLRAEQTGVT